MTMNKIDMVLFDKWLCERRYIKKKMDRNKIINLYYKLSKNSKSINEFEEELLKLDWNKIFINYIPGFEDEIIGDISRYIMYWNYREDENKKLEEL